MSKFKFIESPNKGLDAADVVMPHLSDLSKDELDKLKGGYIDCDAVCLPPGYDYPCKCLSNLCVAYVPTDPIAVGEIPNVDDPILVTLG